MKPPPLPRKAPPPLPSERKRLSVAEMLSHFLSEEDLRYLNQATFPASQKIRGIQTGLHKARLRGGTTEFAEHRAYSPGDEVRRIDWRAVGRSDKLEIKLYDDPSTLGTVVLLDGSGSMGFKDSTRSKYDYGCAVTAFLTKLLLGQRDPVGLLIARDNAPGFLWPKTSSGHLMVILDTLYHTIPSGKTRLAEQLRFLASHLRYPSRVMIVSDGFTDLATLEPEIARLTGRQHRFHLLQTVAPEEVRFDYRQPLRFASMEVRSHLDANPQEVAEAYREALETHIESLRRLCLRHGASYEPLVTDQPLGRALMDFIRRNSDRRR